MGIVCYINIIHLKFPWLRHHRIFFFHLMAMIHVQRTVMDSVCVCVCVSPARQRRHRANEHTYLIQFWCFDYATTNGVATSHASQVSNRVYRQMGIEHRARPLANSSKTHLNTLSCRSVSTYVHIDWSMGSPINWARTYAIQHKNQYGSRAGAAETTSDTAKRTPTAFP